MTSGLPESGGPHQPLPLKRKAAAGTCGCRRGRDAVPPEIPIRPGSTVRGGVVVGQCRFRRAIGINKRAGERDPQVVTLPTSVSVTTRMAVKPSPRNGSVATPRLRQNCGKRRLNMVNMLTMLFQSSPRQREGVSQVITRQRLAAKRRRALMARRWEGITGLMPQALSQS